MPASSDTPSSRTVSSETLTAASGKLHSTQINRRIVPGPIIRNGWALSHTSVKDQQLFLHFVRYAPVQVPSNQRTCRVHFDKEDEVITYYPHHPPFTIRSPKILKLIWAICLFSILQILIWKFTLMEKITWLSATTTTRWKSYLYLKMVRIRRMMRYQDWKKGHQRQSQQNRK